MSKTKDEATAYWLGANVGDKLIGIARRNQGMVIEIFELQEPRKGGPINGEFKIIDIGFWEGAEKLKDLENRSFTADNFIEKVRNLLDKPKIKWLVNVNGFKIQVAS